MPAPKKHMLQSERAFLCALSNEIRPFLCGLTYREAKACGIAGAQRHAIKHGEPVNLTTLSIRRLSFAMGKPLGALMDAAELKARSIKFPL